MDTSATYNIHTSDNDLLRSFVIKNALKMVSNSGNLYKEKIPDGVFESCKNRQ